MDYPAKRTSNVFMLTVVHILLFISFYIIENDIFQSEIYIKPPETFFINRAKFLLEL